MKRLFWFWNRRDDRAQEVWQLSDEQHRQVLALLSEIGLRIIHEARGPVPLLAFGRQMLQRLQTGPCSRVPLLHFTDALKRVIRDMEHERLRVMSPTDFVGVGYVYNAQDPETWPVRSR